MKPPSIVEWARFRRLITINEDGCWIFGGTDTTEDGYVRWRSGPGKPRLMIHVWSYTAHNGPVAPGLQVGHVCHDRAVEAGLCLGGRGCTHRRCCNPDHLEPQTPSENTMVQRHYERAKTECPRGHEYTEENTIKGVDGKRRCRTCDRARKRKPDPSR